MANISNKILNHCESFMLGEGIDKSDIVSYLQEEVGVQNHTNSSSGCNTVDTYQLTEGGFVSIDYGPLNSLRLEISEGVPMEVAKTLMDMGQETKRNGGRSMESAH